MAVIPIRDVPGEAVEPSGNELILIDNGIAMQKATINDAVTPKATEIVNQKISELDLGTASTKDIEYFATAEQGNKADSAVQPGDLAPVATSGDYNDLANLPTLGTAAEADVEDFATAAQGLPPGGATGQVLVKETSDDNDVGWATVAAATAVSYGPQALSSSQQEVARNNIGAGRAMLERRTPQIITKPATFLWPGNSPNFLARVPITIRRAGNGEYETDFQPWTAPTLIGQGGVKTIYVAPNGDDENDGTEPNLPKQTVDAALSDATVRRVVLAPGLYIKTWQSTPVTGSCLIECADGVAHLVHGSVPSTWTADEAGVWYADAGGDTVTTVIDPRTHDEYGFWSYLPKFESLAALRAATGQRGWAQSGSNVYVRVSAAGSQPAGSSALYICAAGTNPRVTGAGTRYRVRNLRFYGGNNAFLHTGTSDAQFILFERCDFAFSLGNGYRAIDTLGGAVFDHCRAYLNGSDGFNYHDDDTGNRSCYGFEYKCIGVLNGRDATGPQNQGSSAHETSRVIRLGGVYGMNLGAGIADVGGSSSWNIGCSFYDSAAPTGTQDYGVLAGSSGGPGVNVWLDDCATFGNRSSVVATGGSTVRVRGSLLDEPTAVSDGASIIEY